SKPFPVLSGSHAHLALKKPPEERCVLIPNLQRDRFHRVVGRLEHLLRLLNADGMEILERGEPGRLAESPLQTALAQARPFDEGGERRGRVVVLCEPNLTLLDDPVRGDAVGGKGRILTLSS